MLKRAKSFFIKRKKNVETERLPADCLTEKSHLARRPIVVDPDWRFVAFREPPDKPDSNTTVRSSTSLRDIEEEGNKVDLRPVNFRRIARPKTVDVPLTTARRLSFPPLRREDETDDLVKESEEKIISR